jgi:hypothetical protein
MNGRRLNVGVQTLTMGKDGNDKDELDIEFRKNKIAKSVWIGSDCGRGFSVRENPTCLCLNVF